MRNVDAHPHIHAMQFRAELAAGQIDVADQTVAVEQSPDPASADVVNLGRPSRHLSGPTFLQIKWIRGAVRM